MSSRRKFFSLNFFCEIGTSVVLDSLLLLFSICLRCLKQLGSCCAKALQNGGDVVGPAAHNLGHRPC